MFLDASKFDIPARGPNGDCPRTSDYLNIKGLNEATAPAERDPNTGATKFPGDAENQSNSVLLCGNLATEGPKGSQTYTTLVDQLLDINFRANDRDNGKGFEALICIDL